MATVSMLKQLVMDQIKIIKRTHGEVTDFQLDSVSDRATDFNMQI